MAMKMKNVEGYQRDNIVRLNGADIENEYISLHITDEDGKPLPMKELCVWAQWGNDNMPKLTHFDVSAKQVKVVPDGKYREQVSVLLPEFKTTQNDAGEYVITDEPEIIKVRIGDKASHDKNYDIKDVTVSDFKKACEKAENTRSKAKNQQNVISTREIPFEQTVSPMTIDDYESDFAK